MFDITFRPLKDKVFDPLCSFVPTRVEPIHVTFLAFVAGLQSCLLASTNQTALCLLFWFLNRALDCLDGALARHREQASDAGGFLDLLSDFIIYSAIPISCVLPQSDLGSWLAVSVLEATFHVNNFILFYTGAILEKQKVKSMHKSETNANDDLKVKELTSVMMRPALIEGFESGVIFTIMLAAPGWIRETAWMMAALVSIGIIQRTLWVMSAL